MSKGNLDWNLIDSSYKYKDGEILNLIVVDSPNYKVNSIVPFNSDFNMLILEINGNDFKIKLIKKMKQFEIQSIKRLSDGEIFSIGDKVDYADGLHDNECTITNIDIIGIYAYLSGKSKGINLDYAIKVKDETESKKK